MELTKNDKGWASIGLARDMSKGEIILIESDGIKATVRSCYLVGRTTPKCDMTQGWNITSSTAYQTGFSVRMSRSLSKVDTTYGTDIISGENPVIYAYTGSSLIQSHFGGSDCGYGSAAIDFSKGTIRRRTSTGVILGFIRHEYAETIIWTVVTDLLILLARHFRFIPYWMDVHWIGFLLVYIMTLIVNDTGQKRTPIKDPTAYAQVKTTASLHSLFANFLTVFNIGQLVVGLLLRASKIWRKKLEKWSIKLSYSHIILGIGIWVLARYLVISGSLLFKARFTDSCILNFVIIESKVFCLVFAELEIYKKSVAIS